MICLLQHGKKGIQIVGAEFFNIKASSLDTAQKKWQLEPNYVFIQNAMGGYSHGKQVLLAMMYSFFNPEDGQRSFWRKPRPPIFLDKPYPSLIKKHEILLPNCGCTIQDGKSTILELDSK